MTRDRGELLLLVMTMPEQMVGTLVRVASSICPDMRDVAAENPRALAAICRNGVEIAGDPSQAVRVIPHPEGDNVVSLFRRR